MEHNAETGDLFDFTDLDEKLTEARCNLALGYLKLGELELAAKAAQDALEIDQSYPPALSLLELIKQEYFVSGLTSIKENNIDAGIRAFQSAVTIDPVFIDAYCEIGSAYLKQGDLKAAEKAITKALRIDSNCPTARKFLEEVKHAYCVHGRDYLRENLFSEALYAFECALEIDSTFTEARCGIGGVYLKQGNLGAAEAIIRQVLRLDFSCPFVNDLLKEIKDIYYVNGFNSLKQGQYEKAVHFFDSFLTMNVDFAEVYCGLALAYLGQGKFSTASWWIRQAMVQALGNFSRSIQLPSYFVQRMKKFDATYTMLCQELQREPYLEEIAEALNLTIRQIEEILMSKIDVISMDLPLGNECSAAILGDLIEDPTTGEKYDPIAEIINKDLTTRFLKTLTEREQRVLKMRFGLEDGRRKTLREVGVALGITRERVRQLEIDAINHLYDLYDEMGELRSLQ